MKGVKNLVQFAKTPDHSKKEMADIVSKLRKVSALR